MPSTSPTDTSAFIELSRQSWADLRAETPLTLTPEEVTELSGINEELSIEEVVEVYLPLSRLLNMYVGAAADLHATTAEFLHTTTPKVPFVIGIGGSVAVGKSTTARVLEALLSRWPEYRRVTLITTDGFLYPNQVLEERRLMHRKGFPESYDVKGLIAFVSAVKAGREQVAAPVYSHLTYDIVPGAETIVERPDILIIEGLNVLQTGPPRPDGEPQQFLSDYFDFSIYVDADTSHIRQWYVERFLTLRETAFRDPNSYFRRYADLEEGLAVETALTIWRDINELNLYENILPTKWRARLVLRKGEDHSVERVWLRKL